VTRRTGKRKTTVFAVDYFVTGGALAGSARGPSSPTSISTPAQSMDGLSRFVLAIAAAVFLLVFALLACLHAQFSR
jgi:hypothetical protein